jgi:hypothetical protein
MKLYTNKFNYVEFKTYEINQVLIGCDDKGEVGSAQEG